MSSAHRQADAATPSLDVDGRSTDTELMQRIACRDERALADLYDRYSAMLLRRALQIVHSMDAAEDVVQESYIAVWRDAARYDPDRGSLIAWLLTIVHRRAVDRLRRTVHTVALPATEDGWVVATDPDPEQEVLTRLRTLAVRAALECLPQEQRRVIELSYLAGHTHRQIAQLTGCPLGTVKGRLRLGLAKLRAYEALSHEAAV
jgi:RNA polymerase sigma-70 factor (ECF subfamily)